jgi:two-component system sensor histidine kinase ChvG
MDASEKTMLKQGMNEGPQTFPKRETSPAKAKRVRLRDRRIGPRRSLLTSRLTRVIFMSNLIGLLILIIGALTMNRFETGLINAKVDNLRSLAATITTVLGEQATGLGSQAELDVESARQVFRGVNVPTGWRVRLHDRSRQVVVDTQILDDTISVGTLDPIATEEAPPKNIDILKAKTQSWVSKSLNDLPWRAAKRERLRRNLQSDIRLALTGQEIMGPRFNDDNDLIVTVSIPVKRVQQVLGVVTVESNDVSGIVSAERQALAPIIGLACLATLLSSLALTLFITRPMRKLSRAAEIVTRSSDKRDSIPDLSNRRDEIGDLSAVMRDMSIGLYSRIDDIANFAADVAHEIKNPLTSLRSASDTLRVAKTKEQREQLIAIIQQDVSRMDRLITDISKASKVDANLARDQAQTLDVREIAQNIIEFYQQTYSGQGARVLAPTLSQDMSPLYIRAFEASFAQVLRNLIDNALTFSQADGVVRLSLSTKEEGKTEWVVITVEDDGPGIPPDNLETVFERFYTQRPKGAQFGSHSGLGLAICRQIITAHKGRIFARNRVSEVDSSVQGAEFIVEVPKQLPSN